MREGKEAPPAIESNPNTNTNIDFGQFAGNPDFVLSLAKGLRVIEAFEGYSGGRSVGDVARHTGLSRAAVRRSLTTLKVLGYTEAHGHQFRLTSRVLRLGFSYLSSTSLFAIAQPALERVTELVQESCSLCVLDGDEIVYIARSASKRVMSVGLSVGSRLPAYCSSMGRVLLSALPDDRLQAYMRRIQIKTLTPKTITSKKQLLDRILRARGERFALIDEELELGLRSIAVPVESTSGRIVAAINIGVHAIRVPAADMVPRFLPILQESAATLGKILL